MKFDVFWNLKNWLQKIYGVYMNYDKIFNIIPSLYYKQKEKNNRFSILISFKDC